MKLVCVKILIMMTVLLTGKVYATSINLSTFTELLCDDDVSSLRYKVSILDYKPYTAYIFATDIEGKHYGYKTLKSISNGEMTLHSEEGQFGISFPLNNLSEAYYYDGGDSRGINCRYFDKIEEASISLPKKLSFIKNHQYKDMYSTDHPKLNFKDILFMYDVKVVDMGDWYPVYLDEKQHKLVHSVLYKEEPEFRELMNYVNKSDLKYHGLLFGRDWYYGTGRVGIALQYEDKLILLYTEFDGGIEFGDEDLDYVY